MKVESVYATSQMIGATPYGKTEVHKTEIDAQGHMVHSVVTYPFFSYSVNGTIEKIEELGKNVDKMA